MHDMFLKFVLFVIFSYLIYVIVKQNKKVEGFDSTSFSLNESVINLFEDVLKRNPTPAELSDYVNQIIKGTINIDGLRRKLIDSDEYQRFTKLQSNDLHPELTKMISDRELINYIAKIYNEEAGKTIPTTLELQLRDIYIYLEYNDFALRAMIRDAKYDTFEKDIMTTQNINKSVLLDIFNKYFDITELINKGVEIFGANPSDKIPYSINNKDSNIGNTIQNIQQNANKIFDKDAAAAELLKKDHSMYSMSQTTVSLSDTLMPQSNGPSNRIQTHKGDMVLIPEFAWSVPQQHQPVCTSLGQAQLVQPLMGNSKLLLGTPLGDAVSETQVGSIMPKFEYKEYITIPN
jgi:hypothetical protein